MPTTRPPSIIIIAAALLFAQGGCEYDPPWGSKPRDRHTSSAIKPGQPEDTPTYLAKVLGELIGLVDLKATETLNGRIDALTLPDPEAWFAARFPDPDVAAALVAEHREAWAALRASLPEQLERLTGKLDPIVQCDRFERPRSRGASAAQNFALTAMSLPHVALYTARLVRGSRDVVIPIESFAFVDGGMRYVGPLTAALPRLRDANGQPLPPLATERAALTDAPLSRACLSTHADAPSLSLSGARVIMNKRAPLDAPPAHDLACHPEGGAWVLGASVARWTEDAGLFPLPGSPVATPEARLITSRHGLALAVTEGSRVLWLDPVTGAVEARSDLGAAPSLTAISSDGQRLAIVRADGRAAELWQRGEATALLDLEPLAEGTRATALEFLPHGKTVLIATEQGEVHLRDTIAGQDAGQLIAPQPLAAITAVAISRDGQRLAVGDEAGRVRLWDAGSQQLLVILEGHAAPIAAITLDEENTRARSVDRRGVALTWGVAPVW